MEFQAVTVDQANVYFKSMLLYSVIDANEETIKKSILTYIQRMNESQYKGKKKNLQLKKEKDPANPLIDDEIMELTLLGIKLGIKT